MSDPLKCVICDLELLPLEALIGPAVKGEQYVICLDRSLCRTREDNQKVKDQVFKDLAEAEERDAEYRGTGGIFDPDLPCVICGGVKDHQWHNASRCTWCRCSLGLVPSKTEASKIVNGWCKECKASWKLEIEKEMGR